MSKQLIECVPNISEGKDLDIIQKITNEITTSEGVTLIDVDSGKATNRTVITFVGDPQSVIQAAFKLIKKSAELIDMTKQSGEHPRMGSTDVCPLVPISGITMDETITYSKKLAKMVGNELNIPVYLYEEAASREYRKNLADIRSGEYEGLQNKITQKEWKPDFGSLNYNEFKNSGATAIGARDFLIAYNINLNTTSTRRANAIAFDIREKGRMSREGGKLNGKILKTKNGDTIWEPGSLKHVKAIGWYIEEYGITQISMNLTNIKETPIHIVFDEVCKKANERGIRVTGSELVGLIPLQSMIDAGEYFLNKQQRSLGIAESEIIKIAQKTMGLDEIQPFNPKEKIIEYVIDNNNNPLCKMSLSLFLQETASESPAPGGGSISAYIGSLGAALTTMVANLSSHKRGWDDQWEEFSKMAQTGQEHINTLEELVDEDTRAFNDIMNEFRLKSQTEKEKKIKEIAIQEATVNAINIPLKIMNNSLELMHLIEKLVIHGNTNSVSDVGVAALCARSAVLGGYLNVLINAKDLTDLKIKDRLIKEAEDIREKTIKQENKIIDLTLETIQNSP
jgi:glutamate formiminotransferase/formiminotetrahydrofolate cyclodeaminase